LPSEFGVQVLSFKVSNKEIEIKFAIADLSVVERRLRQSGFRRVTPRTHEYNTLYDFPAHTLRQRGEMLRLRKYGKKWILTHKAKGSTGRHKTRVETETAVQDGNVVDKLLQALGLRPSFVYEKYRAEWSDGRGHVVLDETPIGNIGEIEGSPRWIDSTARKLGISQKNYITDTYAPMFFAWKQRTGHPAEEMTFAAIGRGLPRSRRV
jgi:adenylate cyclase, class 2